MGSARATINHGRRILLGRCWKSTLSLQEFDFHMRRTWPTHSHIAVAVSGGADSLALALLLASWAKYYKYKLTALSIDHGFRDESASEAEFVQRTLAAHGVDTQIRTLSWNSPPASSQLQELARIRRYEMLTSLCKSLGIRYAVQRPCGSCS